MKILNLTVLSIILFTGKLADGQTISNLTYDSISQNGVTLFWTTDTPSDSKVEWMAPDSNYQPLVFSDSIFHPESVTNHEISISNLLPATIYKYIVISHGEAEESVDSAYFVTQSLSTGKVDVYFNHSVDTSVNTGEKAKGDQNFEHLFLNRIDSALYSIDITLWEFDYYNSIANALINAKNRGVKIRFVYNHTANTPLIDTLIAHDIPVLKRDFDTSFSMHDKFLIFDYRYNTNPDNMFLWTGSTNVSHGQFHSSRNNIIVIQDESLCAAYTREFEEMWGSHTDLPNVDRARFGPQKADNVPHIFNVAGSRMEVYFAPSDGVSAFISNLILTRATKSLFFCMLKFELPNIESALHSQFNQLLQVKGVFDSSYSDLPNSAYPRMKGFAADSAWDPPADVFLGTNTGLIHHKYLIIDANSAGGNKITCTGSYNWETPAETGNDENSITIFDARVNNLYFQEFYSRYRESGGEVIGTGSGTGNISADVPSGFSLYQNYPNPFNPVTKILFVVPVLSQVKISVYNMIGVKLQTLVNKPLTPGTYETSFDGSSLDSGIYFYTISAGDYSESRKMTLLK
jgi:phosphatidylserine/phosphatidylglycerophosphate/cardiolipin synthase-like enzyme